MAAQICNIYHLEDLPPTASSERMEINYENGQ